VTPEGEVMRTRSRARKSSAGYDLTHLFIGSEGTLGVIVECTLRVEPIPEAHAAAICTFATLEDAVACVVASVHLGIDTARIELLDETQVAAVNARCETSLAVAPTLLVECHGTTSRVAEEAESFAALARKHAASDVEWTSDPTRRAALWRARHEAYPAAIALRPGARGIPSDVCVPLSRLADCVRETRKDIAAEGLTAPIVGHVGDGNFHVLFILDPDDPQEMTRYRRVNDRLVRRAIAMDGTCTGEHGVGHGKKQYLRLEHDAEAIEMMRRLKRAIDPKGIMNPGKVVDLSSSG
jgi:D-lactate dehydrogenase (cytochrome)